LAGRAHAMSLRPQSWAAGAEHHTESPNSSRNSAMSPAPTLPS
jgi:hypothetical protein